MQIAFGVYPFFKKNRTPTTLVQRATVLYFTEISPPKERESSTAMYN